jgi:outer membrane cobalamin receptor
MVLLLLVSFLTPTGVFWGQVCDATTRAPVPFAEVEISPPGLKVLTDSLGIFQVGIGDWENKFTVLISRVGYETRVWKDITRDKAAVFYLLPRAIPIAGVTSTSSRVGVQGAVAQPVSAIVNEPTRGRGFNDAGGLIGAAAGAQVNDYGNLTTVMLRGASGEQTVVMLDGVKLNSSLNNLADVSLISQVVAAEVEVMRGGASALYGANPIGGVVNIKTPEPKTRRASAGLGLGSLGRRNGNVLVSLPGVVDFLFAGGFLQADNRWRYRDNLDSVRTRLNCDISRGDLLVKTQTRFWNRHYFSLSGLLGTAERGSPGPVSFPSDSARLRDTRLMTIVGYDLQETDYARLSCRFSHQRNWQNYFNPSGYFTANDTHQIHQTVVNVNQWLAPVKWLTGNFGVEYVFEQGKSTRVGTPNRTTTAFYLEAGVFGGGLELKPALRYDLLMSKGQLTRGEDVGRSYGTVSPKVSLIVTRFHPISLYLGANRSFRAPTFNELWWPDDGWTAGNAGLAPEFGTGVDGGLGFEIADKGRVRFGVYETQFTNLIQWMPDTSFKYQPVNIASASVKGVETDAGFNFRWFGFNLGATYQVCTSGGKELPYRPRLSVNGGVWVAYLVNGGVSVAKLSLSGRSKSKRYTDGNNSDSLAGFAVFDAEVVVDPVRAIYANNRWQCLLAVGCRNVFNQQYQELKDYPLPGRSVYLELDIGI